MFYTYYSTYSPLSHLHNWFAVPPHLIDKEDERDEDLNVSTYKMAEDYLLQLYAKLRDR